MINYDHEMPHLFLARNPRIAVSDSKGCVSIVDLEESDRVSHHWKAHDYEAWICAFDYHNTSHVFSGGDDCKLKLWDLRMSLETAAWTSRK